MFIETQTPAAHSTSHLNSKVTSAFLFRRLGFIAAPDVTRPWSSRRVWGGDDAISRLHISTCTQSATATNSSMGKGRAAKLAQLFDAGL